MGRYPFVFCLKLLLWLRRLKNAILNCLSTPISKTSWFLPKKQLPLNPSKHSNSWSTRFSKKDGSLMQSAPLQAPSKCWSILDATPTGWPYQTIASSPLITAASPLPTGIGKMMMKLDKWLLMPVSLFADFYCMSCQRAFSKSDTSAFYLTQTKKNSSRWLEN